MGNRFFDSEPLHRSRDSRRAAPIRRLGTWGVAAVLMARAIGEFNYIGIFKRRRETGFARRDSRIYTPLTLGLAISCAVIARYGV